MASRYIIIPGCCDLNRGDQALGWETARIAQDAGFVGNYSILAERDEPIQQSLNEGYEVLRPVLEHPSRKFQRRDNINYGARLKILWGLVALKDLLVSLAILSPILRSFFLKGDTNRSRTWKRFSESDAVFMKGGGLIQSHGGLVATYATYYRLYHIFLAHSLNKPVYILPNSFGPFEGPLVPWMVKRAFRYCKLVTAREEKSRIAVKKELNMDTPVYPDLAFYLENGKVSKESLFRTLKIPMGSKVVAITMRPYRFPDAADPQVAYEKFQVEMRKFIVQLRSQGFVPLIIEHTFAVTSHESDGDCIRDVIKGLNPEDYVFLSDKSMNCRDLKAVYGMCDYIVGTRFHSLIFSLSNRVPGIAISYDGYKSIGIMTDMGLQDYVIDIGKVTSEKLISMFNSIRGDKETIITKIDSYIRMARQQRNALIHQIQEAK